jgi:hypothetical protein
VALLSHGPVQVNRAKASEHHITRLVFQRDNEIDTLYGVLSTPSVIFIHPDGLIDSPLVVGAEPIRALGRKGSKLACPVLSVADSGARQHP